MKTLVWLVVLCLFVAPAWAYDSGVATSLDDLMAARYLVKRKVADYNLTKRGSQWYGMLSFCVCGTDRSKIIWVSDVGIAEGTGGQLVSRCRDVAQQKCGTCTGTPALEVFR